MLRERELMPSQENRVTRVPFGGSIAEITAAPPGRKTFNVLDRLQDPDYFLKAGGNPQVHELVDFGPAFVPLIGHFEDPQKMFEDRDALPGKGIILLTDHVSDARRLVATVNGMAEKVAANPTLYDDVNFCREYYDITKEGYDLLGKYVPQFGGEVPGRPVSLIRAGLVTTRLALGLEPDADVPDEVKVKTKRVHPKDGKSTDLMVTVEWMDPNQIASLAGATVDVADFVNPASGASTAAFLLAARHEGATPAKVLHRSFMATEQGIAMMQQSLRTLGIDSKFYAVGVSSTLTGHYYLTKPGVGDAGDLLRHFQPKDNNPKQ